MHPRSIIASLIMTWVLLALISVSADSAGDKPVGIARRTLWTTSRVKGSPEPPAPYRSEVAFPRLNFSEPLDLVRAPGGDRLLVAERRGKIFSFRNDPAAEKELLLDLKTTIYSIVCHPKFAENGFLYVTYLPQPDKDTPDGTKVARFTVERGQSWRATRASEKRIFAWPSGGHNGGCLKFGPAGFLYIGTGDGSGIADELQTGQNLGDVLGAILRIDVDRPDSGKGYGIPRDNPFINRKGARPEVWAYGLRQPWRFSFDRKTGALWAGEVGQDLWEMVYRIEKGGNYGWSVMEGTHPFRPERKRGPTPILTPVVEHTHSDFRSLTGGYVYHGKRLKELAGAYIYGDFDTGRVWALRYDGKKVTWQQELVDTPYRIVSFGEDAAGELFFVDFIGGQIHRLAPRPSPSPLEQAAPFPRKLSETGLFSSTKDLKPAPGLIPYSVNSQLWGDHASKERYLALPGDSKIEFNAIIYPQPIPGAQPGWRFPDGTVLVKTFFLDMERGNPATRRRLETRILHFEQLEGTQEVGDQYWRGYTYIWNDDQTDAELLGPGALDRTFTIRDKDKTVQQTWHFPSRAECTLCHTMPAKFALGVNTLQFNKEHDYGGIKANQLRTLEHLGIFTKPLPAPPEKLPRIVDHSDPAQDLNLRARAYLHSNCSHCHMKWGGGNADFQLLSTLDLKDMGIVNIKPAHGTFDLRDPKLIAPGDPDRSIILYRMKKLGLGRMPHIASSVVDEPAVDLIWEWIRRLPKPVKQ